MIQHLGQLDLLRKVLQLHPVQGGLFDNLDCFDFAGGFTLALVDCRVLTLGYLLPKGVVSTEIELSGCFLEFSGPAQHRFFTSVVEFLRKILV